MVVVVKTNQTNLLFIVHFFLPPAPELIASMKSSDPVTNYLSMMIETNLYRDVNWPEEEYLKSEMFINFDPKKYT